MNSVLFDKTVAAWKRAAEDLGVELQAPYVLTGEDRLYDCVAYLPHFGGVNGMVIGGLISKGSIGTHADFRAAAKTLKLYYSSINLETYSRYDRDVFTEALSDWGYYGPVDKLPVWYAGGRA